MGVKLTEQREIRDCCTHFFTETCLFHNISDQAVALDQWTGFQAKRLFVYSIDARCPHTVMDEQCFPDLKLLM